MKQELSSKLALAAVVVAASFGLSATAMAQDGEALAKSSGCMACHAVAAKRIGPSFKDVAAKYQGQAGAEAMLVTKIQKGGSGNWGKIPMPPNPKVDDAAAKALVTWVMAAK